MRTLPTVFGLAVLLVISMCTYMAWSAQQQRATSVPGYLVVTTCGTLPSGITYTAGTYQAGTMDATGKRC